MDRTKTGIKALIIALISVITFLVLIYLFFGYNVLKESYEIGKLSRLWW